MDDISASEIIVGFAPFLLPSIMAKYESTRTNAKKAGEKDYAVVGGHPFIVLGTKDNLWHITPVFSIDEIEGSENDKYNLIAGLKSGYEHGWKDKESYIFKWQHWLVSTEALIAASLEDTSPANGRRYYDLEDGKDRERIAGYLARAREPFRHPSS